MSAVNGRVIFAEVPTTVVIAGKHLKYVEEKIDLDTLPLDGGVLLKTIYLSPDPYLRGRLNPGAPGGFTLGKPCVLPRQHPHLLFVLNAHGLLTCRIAGFGVGIALSAMLQAGALQFTKTDIPDWWGNTVTYAGVDYQSYNQNATLLPLPDTGYFGPSPGQFPMQW